MLAIYSIVLFMLLINSASVQRRGILDRFNGIGLKSFAVAPQPCFGVSSGISGFCNRLDDCSEKRGRVDGSCALGLGVCCVNDIRCEGTALGNNTYFTNINYPNVSTNARSCLGKFRIMENVVQIKLVIEILKIAEPSSTGKCDDDAFWIEGSNSEFQFSRLCGENVNQHLYIPVSSSSFSTVTLVVAMSAKNTARFWRMKVIQLERGNPSLAPEGCVQYFTGRKGVIKSFNFNEFSKEALGNIGGLNYAICLKKKQNRCGVKLRSLVFQMSAINERRKRTLDMEDVRQFFAEHIVQKIQWKLKTLQKILQNLAEKQKQRKLKQIAQQSALTTHHSNATGTTTALIEFDESEQNNFTVPPEVEPIVETTTVMMDDFEDSDVITSSKLNVSDFSENCFQKDRLILSPTDHNFGSIVLCEKSFQSRSVSLNSPPFILRVQNLGLKHGRGFYLQFF
ncbi:uncharacterized protein B4U80_09110 [Leptotrombidium deliense]|uniref:CUB domain-containing protein n=1 Tax=Leptotrombidium deliense TaxID=299467 RepID=A0A443STF3_9ACAR|nr:uncharacterized protein B4U80_09110 [Leptotrombidium deliense]